MQSRLCLLATAATLLLSGLAHAADRAEQALPTNEIEGDRSPIEVHLTADESHLLTVNQTSDSVSLLSLPEGRLLAELKVGEHPVSATLFDDDRQLAVACAYSGELVLVSVDAPAGKLTLSARIPIGMEPRSVAVDRERKLAYVSRWAADQVAVVDLQSQRVIDQIDVPGQPRNMAISPNGLRLAVAVDAERGLSIIDLEQRQIDFTTRFAAMNVGLLTPSDDSKYVYFPWMVYRQNPITKTNIRRGWVLASRLARQRLDIDERREAFSLDPEGRAVADPHAVALADDGQRIVVTSPGTHELLVFAAEGLPWEARGSTDHIVPDLLHDQERFRRIELGGRPLGVKLAADSRTAYVANYLHNTVQVVDLQTSKLAGEFPLNKSLHKSQAASSTRRGEALFYDAGRSFDQWYSCHSCHREGGGNVKPIDTLNDSSRFTFKTVLPLYGVTETSPWTWHGWQSDLRAAMRKSLTETMLGPEPTEQDVTDLLAYLDQLESPPNPHAVAAAAQPAGSLAQQVARGRELFHGEVAGCTNCHSGKHFTDGEIHQVGTGGAGDRYDGFNTPSLLNVYRKPRLLHDGRASSLEEVLRGDHAPHKVAGERELSDRELFDLIAYLKTL